MRALEIPRADGNGIEETKTHCLIGPRVMAGRADQSETIMKLAGSDGIKQAQKTAHR
jgi:hypothetical protein